MSTLFPSIMPDDWQRMFARARAEGAAEGGMILAQIRAAMSRNNNFTAVGSKRSSGVTSDIGVAGGSDSFSIGLPSGDASKKATTGTALRRDESYSTAAASCQSSVTAPGQCPPLDSSSVGRGVRVGCGLVQRTSEEGALGLRPTEGN